MGKTVFYVRRFETTIGLEIFVNLNKITTEQISSIQTPIDNRYVGKNSDKSYSTNYLIFFFYDGIPPYQPYEYLDSQRQEEVELYRITLGSEKIGKWRLQDILYPVNSLEDINKEQDMYGFIRKLNELK
jgi:hypothetical protein